MLVKHASAWGWLRLLTLTGLLLGPQLAFSANKPVITTSIHPLSLLVAEIAGDQVELHTLISAGQSPHTFQMRPSDRQRLADSDLILWIGPSMELFLQDLMTQDELRKKSLALAPTILPEHFGQAAEESDHHGHHEDDDENHAGHEDKHGEHHGEAHHAGHDHGGEDPHIWLEPGLAGDLAKAIATALKDTGRVDSALVDRNLADFLERLSATDEDIRARLAPLDETALFTYHEAFELFAEHYGIDIAGSLTFSPEVQPGARHLSEVRDRLRAVENPCVLTEPQFSRQWWKSITAGVDLTISQWDPLGTDIEAQQGGYIQFLNSLANSALQCVKS